MELLLLAALVLAWLVGVLAAIWLIPGLVVLALAGGADRTVDRATERRPAAR